MKVTIKLVIALLFFGFSSAVYTQSSIYTDNEMGFTINLPNNYQKKEFWDQGEKNLVAVSPDQNVLVLVRSFTSTHQVTTALIQQAFEKSVLTGATLLAREEGNLNGIPAVAAAYSWQYNKLNTVVGAYFILNGGKGYIVYTIIPVELLKQRSKEADQIIDSFTLLNDPEDLKNTTAEKGMSNETAHTDEASGKETIHITDIQIGHTRDNTYQLTQTMHRFPASIHQIDLVFGYEGKADGTDFILKWYSDTHQRLIKEFRVSPPAHNRGRGHSYITNKGQQWPEGEYHAELWYKGSLLGKKTFIIEKQPSTTNNEQVSETARPGFQTIVSEDAQLEHLIPQGYMISERKTGQAIWSNGSGINMVQQIIQKQGDLHLFVSQLLDAIKKEGALLLSQSHFNLNGLQIVQYSYEYGESLYAYTITENNNLYYLLGFVGIKNKKQQINTILETTGRSITKIN